MPTRCTFSVIFELARHYCKQLSSRRAWSSGKCMHLKEAKWLSKTKKESKGSQLNFGISWPKLAIHKKSKLLPKATTTMWFNLEWKSLFVCFFFGTRKVGFSTWICNNKTFGMCKRGVRRKFSSYLRFYFIFWKAFTFVLFSQK